MEELDKYLNNFYLDQDKEWILAYQFTKVDDMYGVICYEIQLGPEQVWIYNDFPKDQEKSVGLLKSFIPELDAECKAKQISEGHYHELTSRIKQLKEEYDVVRKKIVDFMKYGLEQEV